MSSFMKLFMQLSVYVQFNAAIYAAISIYVQFYVAIDGAT